MRRDHEKCVNSEKNSTVWKTRNRSGGVVGSYMRR